MKNEWISNFVSNRVTYNGLQNSQKYTYYTLINFSDPLFVVISNHEKLVLLYMLQDRGVMRSGKRVKIKEVLYAETSYAEIIEMFNCKASINSVILNSKNASRIGFIGSSRYPEKEVKDFNDISNRIPSENVFFDSKIPSSIDVDQMKKIFISRMKRFKDYKFEGEEENRNFTTKQKISENDYKSQSYYELIERNKDDKKINKELVNILRSTKIYGK